MSNVFTAFHDKMQDTSSLYDNHAIIVDTQYEPFLITQFDLFFIPLKELIDKIKSHKANKNFAKFKRFLAVLFLVLALPFAVTYFLYSLKLISLTIPEWGIVLMKQEIFFAALALLILWHDIVTGYDAQKLLPKYPELDDFLKHNIETQGIQFQQYVMMNPLDFFHPVTFDLIANSLRSTGQRTYIDSAILLKQLLKHEHLQRVLQRLDIKQLEEVFNSTQLTPDTAPQYPYPALQSFILYATEQAILTGSNRVLPEHIVLAIFTMFPVLQEVLQQQRIDFLTFRKTIEWYIMTEQYQSKTNAFDLANPYFTKGGIADGWVKGFTFYLDKISHDVMQEISQNGGVYGIGHAKEINNLIGILQKQFNANAILIGDPGVGKSSIIYGLSQRILEGNVPPALKGLKIRIIDINRFVALASIGTGGLAELMQKINDELRKQVGTILYFDDLEILLNTGTNTGSVMSYIMPLLLQSPVPIIGTMTFSQYATLKEKYPTVIDAFKEIRVDEVSPDDTFTILTTKIDQLEQKNRITITFPALRDILTLTATYQPNKRFPKKAVEVLEQAAVIAAGSPQKKLSREIVAQVIQTATDIPAITATPQDAERLLSLEKRIHQKYINQNDAVNAIVEALQRAKTNLRNTSKALGVFLFLGPSGVGKTELAKITAHEYFGGEFSLIRIDLSQYKRDEDIPALFNQLRKVALRPYTLLLLDEFEKAPASIHDVFMRLFDEGIVVTPEDETLYFNNAIIIATSNVGSDLLLRTTPTEFESAKQQVISMLPNHFKVELINRFDKVIVFAPLSLEHLQQITVLQLNDLVEKLSEQGIRAEYTSKTISYLVSHGYVPGMGARPLRRAMQDLLEASLAQYILKVQQETGKNPASVDFDALLPVS